LSIDDHPRYGGIGAIITPGDMSPLSRRNGKEGIEAFRALRPTLTLMDLHLRISTALDVMIAIRRSFPMRA